MWGDSLKYVISQAAVMAPLFFFPTCSDDKFQHLKTLSLSPAKHQAAVQYNTQGSYDKQINLLRMFLSVKLMSVSA